MLCLLQANSLSRDLEVIDGGQGFVDGKEFAADVLDAKRFHASSVLGQIRQSQCLISKQINTTCGVFGCILRLDFPNQTRFLSDVLGQRCESLGHVCAEWAAAGEINLQYNHGLFSLLRIMVATV